MWIVFRDPKTDFNHLDKFVLELVEDDYIEAYQHRLHETLGGRMHDFHRDVYFVQPLFTSANDVEYFVRKYKGWPNTETR